MISNTDALIAEVKEDLGKLADANLLDEDSMYRDIVLGLKKFGNDIMEIHETVVEVVDGFAELPDNFHSLYLAALCEPMGYKTTCDTDAEFHDLQDSNFYRERTVYTSKWSECDACCETITESVIRENYYYKRKKSMEFYYQNPQLLSLGATFNRNNCHAKCRNKLVKDNPNEIVIKNYRLQANFNTGNIYMIYYGLPVDENGKVDIPETKTGDLEEYLEYRLKRKIAERLTGNKDAAGITSMFQTYFQLEQQLRRAASNEVKMGNINPKRYAARMKRLNRLESLQYESALARMYT